MKASISRPLVGAALLAGAAFAQGPVRWPNLEDGLRAAKRNGRPVLVITTWKPGV